jgi:hypothetical protein
MKVLNTLDLTNNSITNVASPSASTDAANKAYVDTVAAGLAIKAPCRVASTANLTITAPGSTIDGVTMASGDRVLLKNQSTASQNGIYAWNGAATSMTRSTDTLAAGVAVQVNEGTVNADKAFVITTDGAITVGTTAITWSSWTPSAPYTAGNGIDITGYAVSGKIKASGSGLTLDSNGFYIDRSVVPNKYAASIGDGSSTSIAVTHGLNTSDVEVQVREVSSNARVMVDFVVTSTTVVTLTFNTAPTTNQYRVVIIG